MTKCRSQKDESSSCFGKEYRNWSVVIWILGRMLKAPVVTNATCHNECNGNLAGITFSSYFRLGDRVGQTSDIGKYAQSFQLLYDHSGQSIWSYGACYRFVRDSHNTPHRAFVVSWSRRPVLGCFALDYVYRLQVRRSISRICRYPYVPSFRGSTCDAAVRRNSINRSVGRNSDSRNRSVLYIF